MGDAPLPSNKAAIIFSASLVKRLSSEEFRLLSTPIGVRRVRASNKLVLDAFRNKERSRNASCGTNLNNEDEPTNISHPCDENEISSDSAMRRTADDAEKDNLQSTFHKQEGAIVVPNVSRRHVVVYKTTGEDGIERRMNTQEKKRYKHNLRKERAQLKKDRRKKASDTVDDSIDESTTNAAANNGPFQSPSHHASSLAYQEKHHVAAAQKKDYYEIRVSRETMEMELAELRGERHGVPPVILSAPMVRQAIRLGLMSDDDHSKNGIPYDEPTIVIDDTLASQWARRIKDSMHIAEENRSRENIKPMAYQLVPEVWSRLRPLFIPHNTTNNKLDIVLNNDEAVQTKSFATKTRKDISAVGTLEKKCNENCSTCTHHDDEQEIPWMFVPTTPHQQSFDPNELKKDDNNDCNIVYDCIYNQTKLTISCGAKFGCDFLLYDGSREKRHAFAGLRVYSTTPTSSSSSSGGRSSSSNHSVSNDDGNKKEEWNFPLSTPYDLAGYVRGLNTAGKLALLATVVPDDTDNRNDRGERACRVLFVDVALEKTSSRHQMNCSHEHRQRKRRREMGKHLDKQRKSSSRAT